MCLLFAAFSRKKETPFFFSSDKTFYLGGQFLATIYRQHNPSYSKQNSILPMSGLTIIIMIVIILREIEKKSRQFIQYGALVLFITYACI